jgi:hypothetical protein
MVEPQPQAQLGRMVLDMPEVVNVQLGARHTAPREAARCLEGLSRFASNRGGGLLSGSGPRRC